MLFQFQYTKGLESTIVTDPQQNEDRFLIDVNMKTMIQLCKVY